MALTASVVTVDHAVPLNLLLIAFGRVPNGSAAATTATTCGVRAGFWPATRG